MDSHLVLGVEIPPAFSMSLLCGRYIYLIGNDNKQKDGNLQLNGGVDSKPITYESFILVLRYTFIGRR